MYCKNCGKRIDDDNRYCAFCGANVVQTAVKEVMTLDESSEDYKLLTNDDVSVKNMDELMAMSYEQRKEHDKKIGNIETSFYDYSLYKADKPMNWYNSLVYFFLPLWFTFGALVNLG